MNRPVPNYVELPAADLSATKHFYSEVFGWKWTDYGPTYAAADASGLEFALTTNARCAAAPRFGDESSIGPLVLFQAGDLESEMVAVTGAGGEIVTQPFDYPGGSRFHFSDPSGNVLGIYRPDPS